MHWLQILITSPFKLIKFFSLSVIKACRCSASLSSPLFLDEGKARKKILEIARHYPVSFSFLFFFISPSISSTCRFVPWSWEFKYGR